ncbi:hypothetical protein LXL04_017258 [Taraxacum kok-saghyz]
MASDMLLSRTKNQPAHYMLEIESFSILCEDPTIKIESDVFEASGYNWRLDLYPNRRDEENGTNHISLYLIACEIITAPIEKMSQEQVHFDVKFFLYDHIGRNYVTFQDVDGKRISFHKNQTKWGFDKLISVGKFRESSNGYLFDDSCVFGVEVLAVPKNKLKDRILSMINPPATMNTYSWIVDKFSAVTNTTSVDSEVFKIGKVKILSLYRGNYILSRDLVMYLKLHKPELLPDSWKVYAKFEVRVKNQSGYDDRVTGYIISLLMLSELTDPSNGFLLNDCLTVEARISTLNSMLPTVGNEPEAVFA